MQLNDKLSELLGLGPNADWPHSEEVLLELIQLQREKEVTKQQYFRLEILGKSTDLLNKCLHVNMPPHLIPLVFAGEAPSEEAVQRTGMNVMQTHQAHQSPHPLSHVNQSQPQPQGQPLPPSINSPQRPLYAQYQQGPPPPPPPPQHMQVPPQHQQQQQQQHQQHQQQHQQQQPHYGHLAPPVKFHRPHSPAKIGAAAVAQLERSRFPPSPMHKRTLSTPVAFGASLGRPPQQLQHHIHQQQPTSPIPRSSGPQRSMMNTMSSIQFINENPGRKRRRPSDSKENINIDDEGDITEDEPSEDKTPQPQLLQPVGMRKIRHLRTRSDNFIHKPETVSVKEMAKRIDEQGKDLEVSATPITRSASTTQPQSEPQPPQSRTPQAHTPSSGPKFANNILSSA